MTTEHKDKLATGRRMAAERRASEKITSTGFGESKIFCDPNAVDANAQLRDCHIGGKRIGDIFSEEHILQLTWHHTDEGIAARNEGKSDIRVEVGNPLDKQRQRKKDDVLERGMETWEATDPMREQVAAHVRPGFRSRYLSDNTVKNKGTRGWQPVIVDGDPVKLGNMTLAEMPESKAVARNKHYQEIGNQRLKQNKEQYMESGGVSAVSD